MTGPEKILLRDTELELTLNAKFSKEVRLCIKCWMKKDCGHIKGHPQDGCLRFYEIGDTTGKTAFFIDFKYTKNGTEELSKPAFSMDFLENETKNNLQNKIILKLTQGATNQ